MPDLHLSTNSHARFQYLLLSYELHWSAHLCGGMWRGALDDHDAWPWRLNQRFPTTNPTLFLPIRHAPF